MTFVADRPALEALETAALSAARAADVEIRRASNPSEVTAISELLAKIWGTAVAASPGPRNILLAIADTGGYVAGAWRDGNVIGASFGVTYLDADVAGLRSQVTGAAITGVGVGTALKRHQMMWAASVGLDRITWTFDPLVRRNAHFNLNTLGARVVRFVPDFYGALDDGFSGSDETDRCVVRWDVTDRPTPLREHSPRGPDADIVLVDRNGRRGDPIDHSLMASNTGLLIATPDDITKLRRSDPVGVARWRSSLRTAFVEALELGLVAYELTPGGAYRFRAPVTREHR